MAEHERYRHRHFTNCPCYDHGEATDRVSYESERVVYECVECGDVRAVFYRVPELERERAKADNSLIGRIIKADRFIAWVGYAKNPSTVPISDDELREKAKELCSDSVNKALFGTRWVKYIPSSEKVFTLEQAEGLLDGTNWRVRKGFYQWARYELRGEAYRKDPLRNRGFWFQDVPVEGEVTSIVPCVTGKQVSARVGYLELDDYEPAYLDGSAHHVLYGIVMTDGQWRLVHPADVEVQNVKQAND